MRSLAIAASLHSVSGSMSVYANCEIHTMTTCLTHSAQEADPGPLLRLLSGVLVLGMAAISGLPVS